MEYRKLGMSDVSLSVVGFGTWGIGSNAYGPVDDEESASALQYAFARDIDFFDVAPIYGIRGRAEKLIGDVFGHRRHMVVLSTKVGYKDYGPWAGPRTRPPYLST